MGWSIGYDSQWKRDIGYGVPAICDHLDCNKEIDRGLAYVCCNEEPRGGEGCGLYFCEKHKGFYREDNEELAACCERCRDGLPPFPAKPDDPMWTKFKLADESWKKWRKENGHPEPKPEMIEEIRVYEESLWNPPKKRTLHIDSDRTLGKTDWDKECQESGRLNKR